MGGQSIFSDDLFDEENDEYEFGDEPVSPPQTPALNDIPLPHERPIRALQASRSERSPEPRPDSGKRVRVRPMPRTYAEKHPEVVTLTVTRRDGRQLIFVRK